MNSMNMKVGKFIIWGLILFHFFWLGKTCLNSFTYKAILSPSESYHASCAYTIASGEHLYGPYDKHITRKDYTPLSFQIQAMAIRLFGVDIRVQRVVATFFSVGAILLVGLMVKLLTGSRLLSFAAAAAYAGIDVPGWYIEVGPQPMHVFFAMLGVFLLLRDRAVSWRTLVISALSFFCCYWSKQTGLAYMMAFIFYVFIRNVKKGVAALLLLAVLFATTAFYETMRPGSMFWFNVFQRNALDPLILSRFWNPILYPQLLGRFGVLIALIISGLFTIKWFSRDVLKIEYIMLGASAFVGIFAAMKYGSGQQQALIFYGLLIVNGIVFLHQLQVAEKLHHSAVFGLLIVQLLALRHDSGLLLITPADEARYDIVMRYLSTPGKNTYMFEFGYLNLLAGKPIYANPQYDTVHKHETGRVRFYDAYQDYWDTIPFDILIVFLPLPDNGQIMVPYLNEYYRPIQELPAIGLHRALRKRIIVFEKKTSVPDS